MIREKRKKARIIKKSIFLAITIIVGVILAIYVYFSIYYRSHFFPNTQIGETNVSGMTAKEAAQSIKSEVNDYLLTVFDRDGNKFHIAGIDISYDYETAGEEEKLLETQSNFLWPVKLGHDKVLDMEQSITYDSQQLKKQMNDLTCMNPDNMTAPTDAYLDLTDNGYELIPETSGNTLISEKVYTQLKASVENGETEVTLPDSCYEQPQVTSEDEVLSKCISDIKSYLGAVITYDIEGQNEVVNDAVISSWLEVSDDYEVTFQEDAVTSYIQKLASNYNTYGDVRKFKTSKGDTIEIGGGDYGWVIDKEAEKEKLLEEVKKGTIVTREPIYSQTALYRSENDIGDTYIEVDYTNQHFWYYEKGVVKIESDMVSGNISKGNGSPDGVFKIVYKKSPAVLRGEDYESDVTYFMPFAYNVGFHDATWRSKFGGAIYKTSGSHGCLNLPKDIATQLYEQVETGTPVIAFYREDVTLTAENTKISNAYSYKDPDKKEEPIPQTTQDTQTPGAGQPVEEDGSVISPQ